MPARYITLFEDRKQSSYTSSSTRSKYNPFMSAFSWRNSLIFCCLAQIADKLCASIGQDVLDCLFSRSILEPLSIRSPVTSRTFRPFVFFVLATLYTGEKDTLSVLLCSDQSAVAHTTVMVYQLLALNVAVNSYDHALLTLLVSNQFVEIKGSVFKKFEKDNLFQITCAGMPSYMCCCPDNKPKFVQTLWNASPSH